MGEYLGDLCTSYLDDYDDLFSQQDLTQRQSSSALLSHQVGSHQMMDDTFETFSSQQLQVPTISNHDTVSTISTKRPAIMNDPPQSNTANMTGTQPQPRESIIGSIEETILSVVQRMALGKSLELPGFGRPQPNRTNKKQKKANDNAATLQRSTSLDPESSSLDDIRSTQPSSSSNTTCSNISSATQHTPSTRSLTLNSAASAKTFARYLRVLEIIHEALVTSVVITKRDIYYRDIALFGTQSVVDKIIDDLSCFYNVPRSNLNVTAASKGLVFGPARIALKNGKVIDCSIRGERNQELGSDDQGALIPPSNQVAHMEWDADFLLIVEKEASFRHLVASGFSTMFPTGILITGRGYPDLATRHMVKYMSAQDRTLPILVLVDCDPYGLDIYSVYKWGSQAQAFDSPNLAVPDVQFLGLSMQDRSRFGIPHSAYVPLTIRDRRKAMLILNNCLHHASQAGRSSQDHRQFVNLLSTMVHIDKKCELQGLCANHEFGMLKLLQAKLVQFVLEA
ncbi:DNA topoisomerase IV, alpha subunit [Lichtheimia hyalospora FSU 10163]|nr:DNA topoisomerase IV, alpha subunit [Lichtheimia hyalospora FSU 10163]